MLERDRERERERERERQRERKRKRERETERDIYFEMNRKLVTMKYRAVFNFCGINSHWLVTVSGADSL
jgi:hypothetical protein